MKIAKQQKFELLKLKHITPSSLILKSQLKEIKGGSIVEEDAEGF